MSEYRVLEKYSVLEKYLNLRGMKYQQNGENFVMRSFIICNVPPNIIRLIISRIRWAGHVALMLGQKRCVQNFGGDRRRKESIRKALA